jgi:hypothetical protein
MILPYTSSIRGTQSKKRLPRLALFCFLFFSIQMQLENTNRSIPITLCNVCASAFESQSNSIQFDTHTHAHTHTHTHIRGRRSVRGSCTSRPIKALARPPRTTWGEAPAKSRNPGKCANETSYGKVQGSAEEGRHGICEMPGGLARRHDGGPPVEGNLRQEPGVA